MSKTPSKAQEFSQTLAGSFDLFVNGQNFIIFIADKTICAPFCRMIIFSDKNGEVSHYLAAVIADSGPLFYLYF